MADLPDGPRSDEQEPAQLTESADAICLGFCLAQYHSMLCRRDASVDPRPAVLNLLVLAFDL
jgi:hypothetical protein